MKYMPQEVFDYGALVLAAVAYLDKDVLATAKQMADAYKGTYGDKNLAQDLLQAAKGIQQTLPEVLQQRNLTNRELAGACQTLAHAIDQFHPSGRRKSKWFRGAWFSGEKEPLNDKVVRAPLNAAIYHFAIASGKIPIGEIDA